MDIRPLGSGVQPGNPVTGSAATSAQSGALSPSNPATPAVADATSVPATQAAEPSTSQVEKAVQKINTNLAAQSQGIEFSIDSSSHRIIVKVVDQSNNEVIRQIPSKEALAIADSLDDPSSSGSSGLLIKQQA